MNMLHCSWQEAKWIKLNVYSSKDDESERQYGRQDRLYTRRPWATVLRAMLPRPASVSSGNLPEALIFWPYHRTQTLGIWPICVSGDQCPRRCLRGNQWPRRCLRGNQCPWRCLSGNQCPQRYHLGCSHPPSPYANHITEGKCFF